MSNEKYLTVKELIKILEQIEDKDKLVGIDNDYWDCFCPFMNIITDFGNDEDNEYYKKYVVLEYELNYKEEQ